MFFTAPYWGYAPRPSTRPSELPNPWLLWILLQVHAEWHDSPSTNHQEGWSIFISHIRWIRIRWTSSPSLLLTKSQYDYWTPPHLYFGKFPALDLIRSCKACLSSSSVPYEFKSINEWSVCPTSISNLARTGNILILTWARVGISDMQI